MDTPKISKITIDNLELIDSRAINLFSNKFQVQIENIIINFEFTIDWDKNGMLIKMEDENTFNVTVYNFKPNEIRIYSPAELGSIDGIMHYFSITGLHNTVYIGDHYGVLFNLFREIKNG